MDVDGLLILIDDCDRCLVAFGLLVLPRIVLLYLSHSTCCLKRQVESPTSLGTIHTLILAPRSPTSWLSLSCLPDPFRQVGLVTHHQIPDLALVHVT